jgi:hypothetical protein
MDHEDKIIDIKRIVGPDIESVGFRGRCCDLLDFAHNIDIEVYRGNRVHRIESIWENTCDLNCIILCVRWIE